MSRLHEVAQELAAALAEREGAEDYSAWTEILEGERFARFVVRGLSEMRFPRPNGRWNVVLRDRESCLCVAADPGNPAWRVIQPDAALRERMSRSSASSAAGDATTRARPGREAAEATKNVRSVARQLALALNALEPANDSTRLDELLTSEEFGPYVDLVLSERRFPRPGGRWRIVLRNGSQAACVEAQPNQHHWVVSEPDDLLVERIREQSDDSNAAPPTESFAPSSAARYDFVEVVLRNDAPASRITPRIDQRSGQLAPEPGDGSHPTTIRPRRLTWTSGLTPLSESDESIMTIRRGHVAITDARMTLVIDRMREVGQSIGASFDWALLRRAEGALLAGQCWHSWPVRVSYRRRSLLAYNTLAVRVDRGVSGPRELRLYLAGDVDPRPIAQEFCARIARYRLTHHELSDDDRSALEQYAKSPSLAFAQEGSDLHAVMPGALQVHETSAAVHVTGVPRAATSQPGLEDKLRPR